MPAQNDSDAIIGDPGDFAIRAGVEPNLPPKSLIWGHTCVFCGGMCLGDINNRHAYSLQPSVGLSGWGSI